MNIRTRMMKNRKAEYIFTGVLTHPTPDRSSQQRHTTNASPSRDALTQEASLRTLQPGRSIGRRQQTRRLDLKDVDWLVTDQGTESTFGADNIGGRNPNQADRGQHLCKAAAQ